MSTPELGTASAVAAASEDTAPQKRRGFRRRQFVTDWRYQLRVSFLGIAIVFTLLVLLNVSVYLLAKTTTDAYVQQEPALESVLRSKDLSRQIWLGSFSLLFLSAYLMIRMMETHKTAGATYRLKLCMDKLNEGHYNTPIFLRQTDNLQDLCQTLNEFASTLKERTQADIDTLDELSSKLESGTDARSIATSLQEMAAEKRTLLK